MLMGGEAVPAERAVEAGGQVPSTRSAFVPPSTPYPGGITPKTMSLGFDLLLWWGICYPNNFRLERWVGGTWAVAALIC
jgi:hypothetical protein